MSDGDEPSGNGLSPCIMDSRFPKLIPLTILSSLYGYGDEVFFPPSANSDETSDYPRVLGFYSLQSIAVRSTEVTELLAQS
jgi:hypothetical protein